jgi:outer membrane protein assembly factor BamA
VFLTAKRGDSGFSLPYQDGFLLLTIANLLGGRGRLELRPSYTRENNLRYHGLGNASQAEGDDVPARDFYTRVHPALLARGRYQLYGPLNLVVGALYTHSWIDFEPQSNLVRDLTTGSPEVKSLLNVDRNHGLFLLEAGLLFDTRDNEIAPNRGQLHSVKLRASPGGWGPLPYHYVQINLNVRGFHRLGTDRLVFAWRGIGDLLLGTIPFYELSRYDEASAIGGANGVRGIRGDRYYGKRKLFGNLELRAVVANFHLWDSQYALGTTAFVDGGRVWADLTSAPELDGTGVGLKYGIGGGLRLRKGETFVLRADLAWSPDARPIGFYFLAGHIF